MGVRVHVRREAVEVAVKVRNRGFIVIELLAVIAIVGVLAAILLPALARARDASGRRTCQNNLKQIGVALKMYASESHGNLYPHMNVTDCDGRLRMWNAVFDLQAMHSHYLADPAVLACPTNRGGLSAEQLWDQGKSDNPNYAPGAQANDGVVQPCEVVADTYYYNGFALGDETFAPTGVAHHMGRFESAVGQWASDLASAYASGIDAARAFADQDWALTPDSDNGDTLYRLRAGMERFIITDVKSPGAAARATSLITVMHDTAAPNPDELTHAPGGVNVLYLDGHVGFVRWRPGAGVDNPYPLNDAGYILHAASVGIVQAGKRAPANR